MKAELVEWTKAILLLSILCFFGPIEIKELAFGVPISLQSLIILTIPFLVQKKFGLLIIIIYILLGCIGLPVFADYSFGWSKLIGPTAGFIFAFPIAAYLLGYIDEFHLSQKSRRFSGLFLRITFLIILGHLILLLIGMPVLSYFHGSEIILPIIRDLIPGLLIKSLLGGFFVSVFKVVLPNYFGKTGVNEMVK